MEPFHIFVLLLSVTTGQPHVLPFSVGDAVVSYQSKAECEAAIPVAVNVVADMINEAKVPYLIADAKCKTNAELGLPREYGA